MTREEAIEQLQNCKGLILQDGKDWLDERDIPLIDMAISALSADSDCNNCKEYGSYKCTRCDGEIYYKADGDLINRADAIESVCDVLVNNSGFAPTHGYHIAEEALNGLPSVSAEPTTRERKEAKRTLLTLKHLFNDEEILKALDVAIECVSTVPKRGEWINEWKDIDGGRMYGACCSLCHSVGHAGYRYCPNCGAYMGVSE